VEIIDKRKDLGWRSIDACRSLDAKRVRSGRGKDEKSGDQNDHYDNNYLEHLSLPGGVQQ
jgi:hypothetical protein